MNSNGTLEYLQLPEEDKRQRRLGKKMQILVRTDFQQKRIFIKNSL